MFRLVVAGVMEKSACATVASKFEKLSEVSASDVVVELTSTALVFVPAVWNACGYPKSLNFDDEGNWVKRRWGFPNPRLTRRLCLPRSPRNLSGRECLFHFQKIRHPNFMLDCGCPRPESFTTLR